MALWLSLFIISYNVYVMSIVIVPITRDFVASISTVQSSLILVSLMSASFINTSYRLEMSYGHRNILIAGLLIFSIGLIITALSSHIIILVLGYGIISGLGSAVMVTVPWTWMNLIANDRQRNLAAWMLGLALVAGSQTGSFLGGYLTISSDWRWAFIPPIILAFGVFLLIRKAHEPAPIIRGSAIPLSGLLLFIALTAIFIGLSLANEYGFWLPRKPILTNYIELPTFGISISPILISLGIFLLLSYGLYRKRTQSPSKNLAIWSSASFKISPLSAALATSGLYSVATAALTFTFYLFLQASQEITAFDAALAMSPYFAAMLLTILLTFQLARNIASKYIVQTGLAALAIGLWPLANVLTLDFDLWDMFPALIVMGIGAGLVTGQIAELTLASAEFGREGPSNGLYNSIQDLGYAIGISVFGSSLIYIFSFETVNGVLGELDLSLTDIQRQELITDIQTALQLLTKDELEAAVSELPANARDHIDIVSAKSELFAMKLNMIAIAIVLLLAGVCSLFMQSGRRISK